MSLNEYLSIIANSNVEDWIYDDNRQSYLYKPNISIMMYVKYEEEYKEFPEEWVKNFPSETAYVHVVEFHYNGSRIDDFYTAIVDGCRMCIPYPKFQQMTITQQQYRIGRIINIPYCGACDRYDEYLKTAGITVN